MDPVNLLLHPVRLRITHALAGGRELTTGQLSARMPGVPKVTMYRQVALLVDGGFLEVAGEQRVRGAVERRLRLRQDRPVIDASAAAAMSLADHRPVIDASAAAAMSLADHRPVIDASAAAAMSLADHRRGFAAAMAVLIAEFDAYLGRDGADPVADLVSYRQGTVWLRPEELGRLMAGMAELLRGYVGNQPAPGRVPYLMSSIVFPGEPPSSSAEAEQDDDPPVS